MATLNGDASRRFLKLDVGEVSVVGEPANEEDWLVRKAQQEEANMATAAVDGGVERVVVKAAGDPSDPLVIAVLKEVGGIVDAVAKLAGTSPADVVKNVTEAADVEKGMTLKGFLKAAGMSDEMMKTAEAAATKSGLDMTMKLMPPALAAALGDKGKGKDGKDKKEDKEDKPTTKSADEPLTLSGLLDVIAKAKSFTPGRVDQLKAAKAIIDEMLGDVDTNNMETPANLPKGTPPASAITSVSKGAEATPDLAAMLTAAVEKAVKPMADELAAVKGELAAVKKARPASGSLESEGGTDTKVEKGGGSFWKGVL